MAPAFGRQLLSKAIGETLSGAGLTHAMPGEDASSEISPSLPTDTSNDASASHTLRKAGLTKNSVANGSNVTLNPPLQHGT